ncbi:MAG: DUF4124 domain-containing protein [Candidatus Dadabacteria bacterium]|nr:DUF4124 domain-containing protein [Candidatus Dadabacteria bacterium]
MFMGIKTTCLLRTLLSVLFLALPPSFESAAQEAGGEGGGEETPQAAPESAGAPIVIEEEPYEYYYWPDENINNFGLSSMGEGTTMGKTPRRKSNLEANPAKPVPTPVPEDEEEIPADEAIDSGTAPEPGADRQTGASGAAFYKWVDDKGRLHITNNIGEVPLEYQQQIYRQETPAGE